MLWPEGGIAAGSLRYDAGPFWGGARKPLAALVRRRLRV